MSTVCPSLYRDKEGRFICSRAQQEVDPVFMPCLSNYTECPIFSSTPPPPEVKEEVVEKPVQVVEEAVEAVEKPIAKKVEEEEELIDKFENILREVDEIDSRWVAYESSANKLLETWNSLRNEALRILASIDSTLQTYAEEIKEVELKYEMGLLNEESYREIKEKLENGLKKYENIRIQIIEYLDTIENRIDRHYQRLKVTAAKPDIGKLKISLMKLEEMYNQGKIDKNTFEKIKSEIEYEIKRLEKLMMS
ncbi:MAG: hypothetical protein DRJ44_01355 [Thermoprotei archaeon]|nr:MAG: hypothetical protein DRJ44_01355 [Thermoprotei archaeon]